MLNSSQAAVVFDGSAMKFTVIADRDVLENIDIGETLEYNGTNLTVLQLCPSVHEAETACEQRQKNLVKTANGDSAIARIVFNAKGDALSEYSVEHSDTSSPTDAAAEANDDEEPLEEMDREMFREMLMNMIREIDLDIARFKNRKDMFQQIYVQYFGTGPDGSITDDGEDHARALTRKLGSKFICRISNRVTRSSDLFSHIDRLTENKKRQHSYPPREERQRREAKRPRYEDDVDWPAAQEKRVTPSTHVGRTVKTLSYPYLSKEEEERILREANGSASTYAQSLAKLLFADTIDLYFKDQDPGKRQWVHEAVDFRFPSRDRNSQNMKWKNCSTAINKNMRSATRPPVQKPKPVVEKEKPKREVNCTYVSAEYEEDCYQRAGKDPIKYAEFMSLKLFEGSWDKFFKDQDPKMKDWLRDCVDKRYPLSDKLKRDNRWKVCAAACNRNRTKVVGQDGRVNDYPYFPKELEEECFRNSHGLPYVYAEAMSKLLFPDTRHLFFKEQDRGRRNWLHEVLDRRFPSRDKLQHVAKWKSCTTAINRARTEKPEAPAAPSDVKPTAALSIPKVASAKQELPAKKKDDEAVATTSTKRHHPTHPRKAEKEHPATTAEKEEHKEEMAKKERESTRISARAKSQKAEPYSSYPFMTEEEEIECYDAANRKDVEAYARAMGRVLFKDNIKALYQDQDEDRRLWFEEILQFRFPTWSVFETKTKVRAAIRAINKNATPTVR
ncbi:hypothetical protein Q1695_005473 [Nippostrongylus brasiliensis]|nr:hypothetical protein Q1695_005473 [Nippostrongylus brasiliensis]